MPIYTHKCSCGVTKDEYYPISSCDKNEVMQCPKCGAMEYRRQVAQTTTDLKEFHKPIEMYSIGCNSLDEIRAMQKAGVSISDDEHDPMYGIPIAHSRHEKLKALGVAGFVEAK